MELEYYKVVQQNQKPFVCPHNEACICTKKNCIRCGWHPIVAKYRIDKLNSGKKL